MISKHKPVHIGKYLKILSIFFNLLSSSNLMIYTHFYFSIGQTKTVKVYRLMMRKSYEMVMFKAASLKLGLDYAVMHNMNAGSSAQEQLQQLKQDIADAGGNEDDGTTSNAVTGSATKPRTGKGTGRRGGKGKKEIEGISLERTENYSSLSKRELENLLKHGAYDIFREEKDGTTNEESAKFHEADIDQILQRSAVVLHDEKGNSAIAKTSGIASFAKASFVSSLSANGASDNLALDDPDFWTKVVGLASKEEEYSDGNRKRKCAREVSYKEPGMSAFRAVHDSDSDDEEGGRRKKKGVRDPEEPEPVVLNDENLQRITTSLVARGYGNWNTLRSDTKLFWTASDMSRGSRLVILQLLKWAAMSLKSFTGSEEGTDEKEATKSTVGSVTQQVTEFDLKYLESFLRRSRACRLAIAAFERDPFHGDALTHTPATAPESTEIAVDQAVAVTIAEDVLTRQVLELAVGSSSYVDAPAVGSMTVDGISADNGEIESAVTHDALAQVYQAFDNIYPLKVTQASQPASEQGAEAAEDTIKSETAETSESMQSESEQKNPMDKVVELLLSLHLPAEFTEFETERAGKVRFAARSKLSQIEDMFELRLACDLLDQYSVKSSHLDDAIVEETVPLVVQSPIETFLATSSLKAWGVEEDIKLIRAVDKIGWPEGKRRVSNIVEVFIPPIDSEQSNGEVSAELTTDEQNFLVEEEIKSNSITDIAQTVADEQVDIEAEASELAEATTDQVMSENSTEVTLKTYLDDSKFLAKRVKLLAQTLRDFTRPKVEESNRAAERAEAAAERERLAAERIAERERKAAEKAAEKALVQASKDAELKQRRFAQAILRTIARVGRPRSMYAPLREEVHKKLQETIASGGEHYDATTVLITWEQFTADVGLDPTVEENVERVQTAVTTLLQIGEDIISAAPTASTTTPTATSTEPTASTNNADESPKKDDIKDDEKENNDAEGKPIVKDTKMVTTGLFAKVTHRMIESCLDKAHLLHQIRVAVVQHGIDNFFQLRSTVRRSLKGAGPNTQKQKRDTTLPAWWTPYHDTALLQAVLELATPQVNIESIAAEDEESQEVPPEMEMTTSAAKREKEREKEKEKEPTGINWKDIASLPSISKPLPNFSLGFSNPADWVMSISPKVAEKRFQTLIQAPGVLSVSELVPPGSPDVTRKRNTSVQKVVKKPGLLPSAFGARPAWVSSFPSTNKPAATTTASTVTAPTATVSSTSSEPMVVDLQDDDEDVLEVVNICTVPTPASVLAPISTTAIIELIVAVPAEQVQVENKSVSPTELHPQQTNEVVTIDITVDAHPPTVSKDDSIQKEMKLLGDKENLRNASTVSPTTVLDFDPTPQKAPITQVEPVNSSAAPVSVKKASKEKQAPMKAGAILGFFKKAV